MKTETLEEFLARGGEVKKLARGESVKVPHRFVPVDRQSDYYGKKKEENDGSQETRNKGQLKEADGSRV